MWISYHSHKSYEKKIRIYEVSERVKMSFNIGNQGATQQYYLFNFQNQFKGQNIVIELHCATLKNTCIVF